MSRFQEWLRETPPTTLGMLALCVTLHIMGHILFDWELHKLTLCPRLVLHNGQVYRIITSALFHSNIMHIGMNMMSLLAIGASLEKRMGTFRLAAVIMASVFLTGSLYIVVAWVLSLINFKGLMNQHSVGFSGVLFHLSVLECNNHGSSVASRDIFGFKISSHLYPWVLLVLLQVMMPGLSFMGHLSGILVGSLQVRGSLRVLLPSTNALERMDQWGALSAITQLPCFCQTTSDDGAPNTLGGASILGPTGRYVRNGCSKLSVAVFGRGRDANSNVALPFLSESEVDSSQVHEENSTKDSEVV